MDGVRTCATCARRTDRASGMKCCLGLDGVPGFDTERGCYWHEWRLVDIARSHLGECED